MKTVAVLGGGPAGAFAAERLAQAGLKTIVFDEKLAWEKPCGGGLTYKAYQQYPFLIDNDTPKKLIRKTSLSAPKAGEVNLGLANPLVIYSRLDLNRMLLERAEKAGAAIEKRACWELSAVAGLESSTQSGVAEADFCVVATGARNPLREVGTEVEREGYDERAGLVRAGVPGSHRHSIFAAAGRLHLGISAVRASLRSGSAARARLPKCSAPGSRNTWMSAASPGRARNFTAICCRRSNRRGGATTASRAKAGWRWAMRAAWSIPLPARVCITRCARAIWRAVWF